MLWDEVPEWHLNGMVDPLCSVWNSTPENRSQNSFYVAKSPMLNGDIIHNVKAICFVKSKYVTYVCVCLYAILLLYNKNLN